MSHWASKKTFSCLTNDKSGAGESQEHPEIKPHHKEKNYKLFLNYTFSNDVTEGVIYRCLQRQSYFASYSHVSISDKGTERWEARQLKSQVFAMTSYVVITAYLASLSFCSILGDVVLSLKKRLGQPKNTLMMTPMSH